MSALEGGGVAGALLGANRDVQCRFSATAGERFGPLQLRCAPAVRCDGMEEVRGSNPLSSTHLTPSDSQFRTPE